MSSTNEDLNLKVKCSSCRSFKWIEDFGANDKGVVYRTCSCCRERKRKVVTEPVKVTDADDDVVYSASTRNFFMHKLTSYMPKGSWKIVCLTADAGVVIHLIHGKAMLFLEPGETWKQMKRFLDKEHGNPDTWECPICFLTPNPLVLSTCDKCLGDICMVCSINLFEKTCGKIQCPFCRDVTGEAILTPWQAALVAASMREEHGITQNCK
jgi:hypothetical protein